MSLIDIHIYWYVIPLVLAISFVYAASRHESWKRIILHGLRLCGMIFGVLIVATAILLAINTQI